MASEIVNFTITVNAATPPPPALTVVDANGNPAEGETITLEPETVGVDDPGQLLFTVSGGVPPYTVTIGSGGYPAGDQITSQANADGSVSYYLEGTPTNPGNDPFSVTITDSAGTSAQVAKKKA